MIKLLTLVNHDDLREGLRELFELAGDISMTKVVCSAEECMEHLAGDGKYRFHGLLLDTAHARELRLLLEKLDMVLPDLPILALCPRNAPQVLRQTLSNGKTTLLEKDGDPLEMLASIRMAVAESAA